MDAVSRSLGGTVIDQSGGLSPRPTVRQAMFAGALWTIGTRWSVKVLGFASTAVVARLVLPSDYAIITMAYLVVGLVQAVLDFGAEIAVVLKKDIDDTYVNSAWSLRILQGIATGMLLFVSSFGAAHYFSSPEVQQVLWVLAVFVPISASGNIGVILARRELNFALDFRINLIAKLLQAIVTIGAAFWLRDYRALVIGMVVSYLVGWVLTYLMHPYRPKWATAAFVEIWQVTRWLMLTNIANFVVRKADELIASRIATPGDFGLYSVGSQFGQLPTVEIGPAILKAFLPVLSSIQSDTQRVKNAVLKTLAILNGVTLPLAFGLAAVAQPVTVLIFGWNWLGAAPIVALFSLVGALQVMAQPLANLLILRGFARVENQVMSLELVVFLVMAALLVPKFYLEGLIGARLIATAGSVMLLAYQCQRRCQLSLRSSAAVVWRPLVASILMVLVVQAVSVQVGLGLGGLVCSVLAGVVTYMTLMVVSWCLLARPPGLEYELFALATAGITRLRQSFSW